MPMQLLALALLAASGCSACDAGRSQPARPRAIAATSPERMAQTQRPPTPRREPLVSAEQSSDGTRYRLHRFPFSAADLSIDVHDLEMGTDLVKPLETVAGAVLVINGGFFDPDHRPEGLLVVNGVERVPFNERIGGGVLTVSNGIAVLSDASGFSAPPAGTEFAIQCYPRLVADGEVIPSRDTGRHGARTALCVREGGSVISAVVAVGDGDDGRRGPTIFAFAQRLASLGCEQALNLDGGPSTGAAWRSRSGPRELAPRRPVRQGLVFVPREGASESATTTGSQ